MFLLMIVVIENDILLTIIHDGFDYSKRCCVAGC